MTYYYQYIKSPLGTLIAVVNETSLIGLSFTDAQGNAMTERSFQQRAHLVQISTHPVIDQIAGELEAYFHGHAFDFKTPISYVVGTPFQQQVWQALRLLPYGYLAHYSQVAQMIERPKSVRAVATAIGQNPLSIIVPCHRVIRKDGQLGGFNSGLHRKKHLLKLEEGL
ncbi:methylated-DNA--[protein]-cysteine S-methyltransferase [Staphylococcus lutrae]|uniref:methylated-DNA--[protein]-cysteine S-methyltransferase n=1 Tax=Staphylococcus lutrae TaxID=155085 RepID=A0AAC9RSX1_9STAP|nr:methylated-DNA--[protein]-cysteine S-methyltransferase [Staphylococcus lutrae]ARJ50200.1 cysteine methyltransferase [Staphylococcus lutrae]PNZ39339.1 methylated-DNA--[protein]-cysteine S-methyltransferase [Staphylococcus lutrae]